MRRQARILALALVLALPLLGCGDDPVDPRIEAILPDHAKAGESVDVVGERFGDGEAVRQVSFGGEPGQVSLWQETRARVVVPARPGGLTLVTVTVDGRPSNAVSFVIE